MIIPRGVKKYQNKEKNYVVIIVIVVPGLVTVIMCRLRTDRKDI